MFAFNVYAGVRVYGTHNFFYKVPSMLTFINFYSAPVNPRVQKFGVFMRIALTPFLIVMLIFIVFQLDFNYKLWFVIAIDRAPFFYLPQLYHSPKISIAYSKSAMRTILCHMYEVESTATGKTGKIYNHHQLSCKLENIL